jgi:hypothetical protein
MGDKHVNNQMNWELVGGETRAFWKDTELGSGSQGWE